MKVNNSTLKLLFALILSVTVSSCSRDMSDLRQYVETTKNRFHGSVEPLPQFQPYQEYSYRSERNPFAPLDALARKEEVRDNKIKPGNRTLEPLEYFPLDSLSMVGTLDRGGQRWGLIKDSEGKIHRVRSGNHIGQDYGSIKKINATSILITELTQDTNGLWVERETQLHIGE